MLQSLKFVSLFTALFALSFFSRSLSAEQGAWGGNGGWWGGGNREWPGDFNGPGYQRAPHSCCSKHHPCNDCHHRHCHVCHSSSYDAPAPTYYEHENIPGAGLYVDLRGKSK